MVPSEAFISSDPGKLMKIKTAFGTITVPSNMLNLENIDGAKEVGLHIATAETSKLTGKVKETVGGRPGVELGIAKLLVKQDTDPSVMPPSYAH